MNTKLLNELELHLHNSELALQLARKAVAGMKAEMIGAETAEYAAKTPNFVCGTRPFAAALAKVSAFLVTELEPILEKLSPKEREIIANSLQISVEGYTEPIDFYAKLDGEHYSHKPCSTDTREPETFLHRKLLEKRLPFQTLLAGLGVATPDEIDIVYAMIFENKPPRYNVIYDTVCDFIENYKPHGEV